MVIVLAHWAEHLAQAWQIYVLGWPHHHARGVLGLRYPWLVDLEILHYGYALTMLIGIWLLRAGFKGVSRRWWTAALVIQLWHHMEHVLLISQAISRHNLFGSPVPTSLLQVFFPRVELHLFYNTVVFVPMVVAVYWHLLQAGDISVACSCSLRRSRAVGAAR